MFNLNVLPELARHEYSIDYATGNFALKIIDYAQQDILENFIVSRSYNSRTKSWKFNLKDNSPKLTLKTLSEIFFIYEGKNLILIKDEIGRVTRYEYQENLLSRVIYPDGTFIKYFYDIYRNLTSCIEGGGKIIFQNEYDEFGRLIKISDSSGTKKFFYDDKNRRTIEQGHSKTIYRWNRRKLIEEIIFSDGTVEIFKYDEKNRLNYKVERNGNEYFWRYYNELLTRQILPDGSIIKFDYDKNFNLIRKSESNGQEEIYFYSSKNLLIEKRVRLNVKDWRLETFERDIAGRILQHNINGQITSYVYDGESPVPSLIKTPCGYKFSCFYDKVFRLLSVQTPAGNFSFAYTPMNEIIPAQKNIFAPIMPVENVLEKFEVEIFDIAGRRIEARQKIGDKFHLTRWKYDLNDNCIERRDWQNLQTLQSATGKVKIVRYEYDLQNRLIRKFDGETLTKYYYDCLNRLTKKIEG